MVNWEEIEGKYNQFKNYAPNGTYKVKCDGVKMQELPTGGVKMKFHFEEGDKVQYPTTNRQQWLSFNNPNWRAWHNRCLMEMFGASEENAKKAIEACEKTNDKETIMKAYEQTFNKLLAKKPEVEIEIKRRTADNGKEYAEAFFTDPSVAMPDNDGKPTASQEPSQEDVAVDTVEVAEDINLEDIPF